MFVFAKDFGILERPGNGWRGFVIRDCLMLTMSARKKAAAKDSSAQIGFEAKLGLAVNKLRNNMDALGRSPFA